MKTLVAILVVCLASRVVAAPDVPAAINELQQAHAEHAAEVALRNIVFDQLNAQDEKIAAKQTELNTVKAERDTLKQQIESEKKARVGLICWGMGAVNGLAWAATVTCIVLGLYQLAVRCGIVAAVGTSIVLGIAFYAPWLAIYGAVSLVGIAIAGTLYIIWEVRQHKDAAIDIASGQQQLVNAGVIPGPLLDKAKSILNEARSKLADDLVKIGVAKPTAPSISPNP